MDNEIDFISNQTGDVEMDDMFPDIPAEVVRLIGRLTMQRDRLRKVLRRVEWSQVGNRCPVCKRSCVTDGKHADDCELYAAKKE